MSNDRGDAPPSAPAGQWRRPIVYALAALIVVAGFVLWQTDLERDPPMYIDGLGQSLGTDPALYTWHARNRILFDDWSPFDYGRVSLFKYSTTSLVAYVWMSLNGVSLRHAHMAGPLLAFGGLIFLLLGLSRHHPPWVLAACAAAFVVNVTLIAQGRVAYLENGLMFWAAAMFWVYSWWGDRIWGIALAGALAAVATIAGKMLGVLLLPALILSVYFSGERSFKRVLTAAASFFGTAALLLLALYGSDLMDIYGYASEVSYGARGFPEGLTSPWAFFEHLLDYGSDNRLYYLNPDLLLMLLVGAFVGIQFQTDQKRLLPTTRLAMFWALCGVIGLMPLNYSPLRYAILFIPAIIIFCLTMLDRTRSARLRPRELLGRWWCALIVVLIWLAAYHTVVNAFYFNTFPRPVRLITWSTLAAALVLGYVVYRLLLRRSAACGSRTWWVALAIVLAATVAINAARIHRFFLEERIRTIAEANADLGIILATGAVVSGPYGPPLVAATTRQSFIHLFGVSEVDQDLFVRYPITHLALDVSNYTGAVRNYPQLEHAVKISTYFIRDVEVGLYRVDHLFGNPTAAAYEPSAYERAIAHLTAGASDSALAILASLHAQYPEAKSPGLLLTSLQIQSQQVEAAHRTVMELSRRFPTDFNIQLLTGKFLLNLAYANQDQNLIHTAETYFARSVELNPYRNAQARAAWMQINAQAGAASGPVNQR